MSRAAGFRSLRWTGCVVVAALVLAGCGDEFSSEHSGQGRLVLNEVDYNNPDIDTNEFIEILNVSDSDQDLSGIVLVLINGEPTVNKEYARFPLLGKLGAHHYLVFTSAEIELPPGTMKQGFLGLSDQIQNGGDSGDAIGLFDTNKNQLIDALSYEGEVRGATIENAGTFDFVEGELTPARDLGDGSLARSPNGRDTNDEASDWKLSMPPTPGAANP